MKLLMVAGEASGDAHGAALITELRQHLTDLEIYGIGGPQMLRQGLRPYYTIDDLQVHGLVEVVRHLPRLYRILWQLRDSLAVERPQAVVLIDYPGFNLKLAAAAKRRHFPVIFFNSPQVWAWRSGRIRTIAESVDKILVLFPFEEKIYQNAGVDVTFVGHPLVGESVTAQVLTDFKQRYHIQENRTILTIAPGSRPSEIQRHMPVLLATLPLLQERVGPLQVLLPVAENLDLQTLEHLVAASSVPIQLTQRAFLASIHVADAAIVSSGTASLQTGLALTPFVIIYRVAPLSFWLAQRLVKIPYIGMVNILAQRGIVPELLQSELTSLRLCEEIVRILNDTAYRTKMVSELQAIRSQLGEPGAYGRAAMCIVQKLTEIR